MNHFAILFLLLIAGCKKSDDNPDILYFPPAGSQTWEAVTPASLGWNTTALTDLYDFLDTHNTRAFIILVNGRIVVERYGGIEITGTNPFNAGSYWYWASAGKSLTSFLASIAKQEGLINIENKTSDYLGKGWTDTQIESMTGMSGTWIKSGYNNVYYSTARDAARFGLLMLNKGSWGTDRIMTDETYFNSMITSSQNLNPSYGYLFWLNGKSSVIYPGIAASFPVSVAPDAPADLYAAMGKNGQFIDIVPSLKMVVVRMGEAPDDSLVPVAFHNDMWKKISGIIG
jgi:CubicO group peptidase (beta-lactamase class C family)